MTQSNYLELLSKEYPTADAVSAEIINLRAICCLPKGTEYFFSDLHGEADAFAYLLGTASGVIHTKIEALFQNSVSEPERDLLSALIYRPQEVLRAGKALGDGDDWCRITIFRLVQVCKSVASKYTRSKVRKKMPQQFAYVLDELLHADTEENKEDYYTAIINAIVETGVAYKFISALCLLIRQCSIDSLHIIGDIFDRGPHADLVMEELMAFSDVDIQWGNHDIHWMGAVAGNETCVANAVRLAISYNNFDLLEDGYGINLRPLSTFAAEVYQDDPCEIFLPHQLDTNVYDPIDAHLAAKMHKAIAIVQFKLEGQLIARHPEYEMQGRDLLAHVDFEGCTVTVDGKKYPMRDCLFPTVNPQNPLELTEGEKELVHTLTRSFTHSTLLKKHIRFLYNNGSMYKVVNNNLLYHGCIPLTKNGEFKKVKLDGKPLQGKAYLDAIDRKIRNAYFAPEGSAQREDAGDYMWYLWCGKNSPIFGKSRLTTFERYFIKDNSTHDEVYNPYYEFVDDRTVCEKILREFGLNPAHAHIVNGHVPVRHQQGESPIKGGGLLFVIDGGISKVYHGRTGIGGYTLISNSHHLALAQHRPLNEVRKSGYKDVPRVQVVERYPKRRTVLDSDTGKTIGRRIEQLETLLAAYREGQLRENIK
ncbi:fructose-1,6-bisphosphatase [Ruminococcaceae bacterium OttesenSCG-928-A16]|nr:fructose-1,6-bisphosphatase [Ruminococcaceae bacterium OttesenSCG-928-A16]